ncbi:ribonuclease H-like domain-containing protein [Tanacetum coccineum]
MSGSQDEIPPPPPPPSSSQTPTQQTPHTVSTIKLPILKKGEYDIWAMKMEHYLAHTDYPIWEVIQNGNGPVSITTDTQGQIKVLPPRTAEEILARERERKARTTLLMALPEDHLAKFHNFDDLYNNLRVFENDVKGSTASSSSTQNVAFVSKNTSSTNDVSTAYGVTNPSGHNSQYEQTSSYSLLANQSSCPQLDHEHLEQLDEFDLEEMDLKWQVAIISIRMKKFYKKDWKDSKSMVTIDGEGVDWTSHLEEEEDYALMAYNSFGLDSEREQLSDASIEIKAHTQGLKKVEAQLVAYQQGQLWYEEKIRFMKIDLDDKTDVLTYHKNLLAEAQKKKKILKAKVENWHELILKILVNTAEVNAVSVVGKRETAVKLPHRFSWVFFLRTKDETSGILKDFIRQIENQLNQKVKTIRCDNGIEFKNRDFIEFYGSKGIKREYNMPNSTSKWKGTTMVVLRSDNLTDSMNYQPVRSENQANKHASPQEANHNAGTEDIIDASDSEKETESAQDYFVLPIWSSYSSTVKRSTAKDAGEAPNKHPDFKTDEKPVDKEDQELLLQAGAAKASSTNIVNTASTQVSTASPYGGLSFTDLTNLDPDNLEIPALEDIYKNPTDGMFTNSSHADEGAVADFTNLEPFVNVSHIPTSRINSIYPSTLILGDPQSAVQTRSKVTKSSGAYAFGKPKLGLWYPRVSSFDLEAYSDSDYAGANLDRKSTIGGYQFLGRRLISWQCKKQTIVATSTTEAEYVAAGNYRGQNPVYHSKTKHIAIRHHFIRDAYEKKLIQVLKIHTDDNVADLLTKAFDVSSYLGVSESLGRAYDGTEALLLLKLFIPWLEKVSTDGAKLVPLGKDSTAIETLKKIPPRV